MAAKEDIKRRLVGDWIPAIYREKVRTQRTRAYKLEIPQRENQAEIFHTLLGVELKVGKRRFTCPDLATARFLRVFARIGCTHLAVPYDITRISPLADELETSWQRLLLEIEKEESGRSATRLRSALVTEMRNEIESEGAGEAIPEFRKSTKQSKS